MSNVPSNTVVSVNTDVFHFDYFPTGLRVILCNVFYCKTETRLALGVMFYMPFRLFRQVLYMPGRPKYSSAAILSLSTTQQKNAGVS